MCSDDGPVATDLPTQVPAVDSFVPAGQVHPGGGAAAAAADSCRLRRAHLRGDPRDDEAAEAAAPATHTRGDLP